MSPRRLRRGSRVLMMAGFEMIVSVPLSNALSELAILEERLHVDLACSSKPREEV